jgi:hypothetical protein
MPGRPTEPALSPSAPGRRSSEWPFDQASFPWAIVDGSFQAAIFFALGNFPHHLATGDLNGDGRIDLVSHYRVAQTGIALGDTTACLSGESRNGLAFEGCDTIETVPVCGTGFDLVASKTPPIPKRTRAVRVPRFRRPRTERRRRRTPVRQEGGKEQTAVDFLSGP